MRRAAAAWAAAACIHAAEAAQWPLAQYNATLVFSSKPQAMGQYLSNDWWVVGPVTLVQTLPAAAGGRHGFEVSPKSIDGQPYDSRSAQYNASLLPALPLTLKPGDSLVKMVSNDGWKGSNPTYITSAMVLTVVGASEKAAAAHGLVQYLLRSTKLISLLRSVFC